MKQRMRWNDLEVTKLINSLWEKQEGKERISGKKIAEPQPVEFDFLGVKVKFEIVLRTDYRRMAKKSRAYVHLSGESLWDNLMNRRNRPTKLYKMILEEAFERAGISKEIYQGVLWSQYAGCTCPCSPGFIVKGIMEYGFYVTVTNTADLAKEDKEAPNPVPLLISDDEQAMMERTTLYV